MRRLLLIGCLAVLTACGTATPAGSPPPETARATGASLHTTGGVAGVDTVASLTRSDPGALDATSSDRLFTLLADPSFAALQPSYLPSNTCCDHFQYDLTVSYADGSTKQVTALSDQKDLPPVLTEVLTLLKKSQG